MHDINVTLYQKVSTKGDISEHLLYLAKLSRSCTSILECGVRDVVSSWAFLNGLVKNKQDTKVLHLCDMSRSGNIVQIEQACAENNVAFQFHECNDLEVPVKSYDMVFIDTWHIYGQLKRELAKFSQMAVKYIVMHDTEIDKVRGETVRCGWNAEEQSQKTGIPVEEITKGLQPAIEEFLAAHPDWQIKDHFTQNNGLTVLERSV